MIIIALITNLHYKMKVHFIFITVPAWSASARIRETLETWFAHYPETRKVELKSRFQLEFNSAFYELFIHEFLLKIGCAIFVHPAADNNSNTHPDFLAKFPRGDEVFIEAVLSKDESEEQRAEHARLDSLYDEINKVKSADFFLNILSVKNPEGIQPSGRKIRDFLNEKFEELDPDEIIETIRKYGVGAVPKWNFSDGEFELIASPIPKSPQIRGRPDHRLIGMFPTEIRWGRNADALRSSVTSKAKQHGHLKKPYIIAVNSLSKWGIDIDDISKSAL